MFKNVPQKKTVTSHNQSFSFLWFRTQKVINGRTDGKNNCLPTLVRNQIVYCIIYRNLVRKRSLDRVLIFQCLLLFIHTYPPSEFNKKTVTRRKISKVQPLGLSLEIQHKSIIGNVDENFRSRKNPSYFRELPCYYVYFLISLFCVPQLSSVRLYFQLNPASLSKNGPNQPSQSHLLLVLPLLRCPSHGIMGPNRI